MHIHINYWLAASCIPEMGPKTFLSLLNNFPNIEKLFASSDAELKNLGVRDKCRAGILGPNWEYVNQALIWQKSDQQNIIVYADEHYPKLLKEIPDPPLVLYIKGEISVLHRQQIAIVGARDCSMMGKRNAEFFTEALCNIGLLVTSGLALGVDTFCHRKVVQLKSATIAVAGTGLQHVYPRRNFSLAREILQTGGAIISEFPLTMPAYAGNFPRRNRIISGLTLGVIIIEAALKSGSLLTAKHAMEQGREVFAVPGPIHHPLAAGCHHLIKQGAVLLEKLGDILDNLPALQTATVATASNSSSSYANNLANLPAPAKLVLQQIEYEITPIDVILLRSRLTAGELSSILLDLELSGFIQLARGGYTRLV